MKIKEVCDRTGLSDRAVRFYMEEKLISPSYTENYLGRKTFNFSEQDVEDLNHIAILRKFGFSLGEIRQLKEEPGSSVRILPEIRSRKERIIGTEQAALDALKRLNEEKPYDAAELARALEAPAADNALPAEDNGKVFPKERLIRAVAALLICLLPTFAPWFGVEGISAYWGYGIMREFFTVGCLLQLCVFLVNSEKWASVMRLCATVLVGVDYVLAFIFLTRRCNINEAYDLAFSMRTVNSWYWLACAVMAVHLIHALVSCAEQFRKKE